MGILLNKYIEEFTDLISNCSMDNTYKMSWCRALVELSYNNPNQKKTILIIANCTWYLYNFRSELLEALHKKGYDLILPNTFTPNGDDINDTIRPWYKCLTFIEMSIYDTFGSLLYIESGTGELTGWDGLINGKPAENGNYILVVRAVSISGKNIEINGPVTLVK